MSTPHFVNAFLTVWGTILNFLMKLVLCSALIPGLAMANSMEKRRYASLPKLTSIAPAIADAKAPWGWTDFCTRYADECDVQPSSAQSVELTPPLWKVIQDINLDVNDQIREASDQEVYGVPERWEYPATGAGDCEDFALEKRKRLMNAGIPRQALLITVVTDESGLGHAILTVRTAKGDFILDNRVNRILSWELTGYAFVKQQSAENPNHWVRLGPPTAPMMTATTQK